MAACTRATGERVPRPRTDSTGDVDDDRGRGGARRRDIRRRHCAAGARRCRGRRGVGQGGLGRRRRAAEQPHAAGDDGHDRHRGGGQPAGAEPLHPPPRGRERTQARSGSGRGGHGSCPRIPRRCLIVDNLSLPFILRPQARWITRGKSVRSTLPPRGRPCTVDTACPGPRPSVSRGYVPHETLRWPDTLRFRCQVRT